MNPGALEGYPAVPRSGTEAVVWPALLPEWHAKVLAIEFQLEQSEWWSAQELREQQFRQLTALLSHAMRTVPFYDRHLAPSGHQLGQPVTAELWSRLPTLSRAQLQSNADALASSAVPPTHGRVGEHQLALAGGPPVRLRRTELADLIRLAFFVREEIWHRRSLDGKLAAILPDPSGASAYPAGRREPDWGLPMGPLYGTGPLVRLDSRASLAEQADWLAREAPAYLLAGPAGILALARHVRVHGLTFPGLRGLRSIGDALPAETRSAVREAWGVPLTHIYRADETGPIALQCPEHECFHIQSEAVLVEVVDAQGRPCIAGETGRVVVTPLHNFAMPLIRYELGHFAEVGGTCPCGRELPVLTRLLGPRPV